MSCVESLDRAGKRLILRILSVASVAALGACATYHAEPLASAEVESILESPDQTRLKREAADLHHPMLKPVELDFAQPLTGQEIEIIAVLANPDLRALRTQLQVADAQVFSSGLLPDPQVSLGYDRVLSPKGEGLISGYAGSLTFDLLGALAVRRTERAAASAAVAQVRNDIAWQEWTTGGQARLLSIRLGYQRRAQSLAREASAQAQSALARALQAAAMHDVSGDEIELRRIAAADARDKALTAAREADGTRLELNRTLGLRPDEKVSLAEPLAFRVWTDVSADELFAQSRQQRLDLSALAQGYATQEATYERAVLGQYPRLGITLNRARDTSNVQTFGPSITLDLPLWNRNRGAIGIAKTDRIRLRAEFAARLHQTRAEIAALVDSLDRDERARLELAQEVTGLDRLAAAFETAASRRDVTQATAESAKSAALDRHIALLALEQMCAEQRVALALAVGVPLSTFLESP